MIAIKKTFQYGDNQVTLETGEIARQTDGAVMVSVGDTVVLVTAVGRKKADPGRDFFPLTINYQEKTYAAGKIPGGFFKREGRPSEKETLTSRLIDRPLRPLFPKGFRNEVQVIATVVSLDPQIDPDIPSLIGASAALAISGMPFQGPIGAARVGYANGEYLLNPGADALETSQLDLVVAGTADAVLMVESEADRLSEDVMLGAVVFGHEQMQVAIDTIKELAAEASKPAWDWQAPEEDTELAGKVAELATDGLTAAYQVTDKQARQEQVREAKGAAIEALSGGDEPAYSAEEVSGALGKLEKQIVRGRVIDGHPRIDGRDTSTVRPAFSKVGVLPRTHGSALYPGCDADHRGVSVCHSPGVRDHRIKRFEFNGICVWLQLGADGCRCADQGTGCRCRHGPGERGRKVCSSYRYSW